MNWDSCENKVQSFGSHKPFVKLTNSPPLSGCETSTIKNHAKVMRPKKQTYLSITSRTMYSFGILGNCLAKIFFSPINLRKLLKCENKRSK